MDLTIRFVRSVYRLRNSPTKNEVLKALVKQNEIIIIHTFAILSVCVSVCVTDDVYVKW